MIRWTGMQSSGDLRMASTKPPVRKRISRKKVPTLLASTTLRPKVPHTLHHWHLVGSL